MLLLLSAFVLQLQVYVINRFKNYFDYGDDTKDSISTKRLSAECQQETDGKYSDMRESEISSKSVNNISAVKVCVNKDNEKCKLETYIINKESGIYDNGTSHSDVITVLPVTMATETIHNKIIDMHDELIAEPVLKTNKESNGIIPSYHNANNNSTQPENDDVEHEVPLPHKIESILENTNSNEIRNPESTNSNSSKRKIFIFKYNESDEDLTLESQTNKMNEMNGQISMFEECVFICVPIKILKCVIKFYETRNTLRTSLLFVLDINGLLDYCLFADDKINTLCF
ncbi:hypothetical protein Avbf_11577 [Armadillidium vulgare]|nr:hypothetical protein Avbf_11577 [Armadillidium vulgare]